MRWRNKRKWKAWGACRAEVSTMSSALRSRNREKRGWVSLTSTDSLPSKTTHKRAICLEKYKCRTATLHIGPNSFQCRHNFNISDTNILAESRWRTIELYQILQTNRRFNHLHTDSILCPKTRKTQDRKIVGDVCDRNGSNWKSVANHVCMYKHGTLWSWFEYRKLM